MAAGLIPGKGRKMSRGSARDSGRPGVQQGVSGATENSHRSHLRQEHSAISGVLWGQMEEVYGAFLASGALWRAENEDFKWHGPGVQERPPPALS